MYRNQYATFESIKTKTITVQGNKGDSKKAKLLITLKRSSDFAVNMEKFNKVREENEAKKAAQEAAQKET